jgi:hypothetical protein
MKSEISKARESGDTVREVELNKELMALQVGQLENTNYWIKKQYMMDEINQAKTGGNQEDEIRLWQEYVSFVRDNEATSTGYQDVWNTAANRLKELNAEGNGINEKIKSTEEIANERLNDIKRALEGMNVDTINANLQLQIRENQVNSDKVLDGLKNNYISDLLKMQTQLASLNVTEASLAPQLAALSSNYIASMRQLEDVNNRAATVQTATIRDQYPQLIQVNTTLLGIQSGVMAMGNQQYQQSTQVVSTLLGVQGGVAGANNSLSGIQSGVWALNNKQWVQQVQQVYPVEQVQQVQQVQKSSGTTYPAITSDLGIIQKFLQSQASNPTKKYDDGSWNVPATEPALVHKGEIIIPTKFADKIRTGGDSKQIQVNIDNSGIADKLGEKLDTSNRLLRDLSNKGNQPKFYQNNDR